jgi:hypothetical protein
MINKMNGILIGQAKAASAVPDTHPDSSAYVGWNLNATCPHLRMPTEFPYHFYRLTFVSL